MSDDLQHDTDLAPTGSPDAPEAAQESPERDFEDLTLAEALGQMGHAPLATLRALLAVARTPVYTPRNQAEAPSIFASPGAAAYPSPGHPAPPMFVPRAARPAPTDLEATAPAEPSLITADAEEYPQSRGLLFAQLILRVAALAVAIYGGAIMFVSPIRSEATGLDVGAPFLLAAFLFWLLSELLLVIGRRPREPHARPHVTREASMVVSPARAIALAAGLITSIFAYTLNGDNMFTLPGVIAWGASIVLWVWAFAPPGWTPLVGLRRAGSWLAHTRIRLNWTLLLLVLIVALGAYYRFNDFDSTPPEMTSDHVELLLDVNRVLHGETNVFFANNGGREAIQFYAMALMSYLPGAELNFHLLKLLTAIEGVILLPLLWWMGRELIGKEEPRLGNAVGLTLAALVAVSYWDEMLSRLGLRINVTPLLAALIILFLARALRYNRRSDFIWCGLALGVGVYGYQAIRMFPVAIVIAVAIALIFWQRTWRDRRHMLMNLTVLVVVSFAVFVPLFHYTVQYPDDFWRRTSGRLFGDSVMETTDANGNEIARTPTLQEQLDAFDTNIPVLIDNFRNALLMFNWKGDVAWINNAPNQPAFDVVTGALLILGIAAWLARMVRRRDPFDWALIPMILILMLSSALSIAYPIENPSATRMSATLPGVYLLTALPLALIALALPRLIGRIGAGLALIGAASLVLVSYSLNYKTYFVDYRAAYSANSLPYSTGGGVLREFASENGYGNAFILAYPYWWDHRALAIDGGDIDWPNTILKPEDVPGYLQQAAERPDASLRFDPTKDILFFYSPDDTAGQQWLQTNFPMGYWQNVTTYQPGHSFNIYRVPAFGVDYFAHFLQMFNLSQP